MRTEKRNEHRRKRISTRGKKSMQIYTKETKLMELIGTMLLHIEWKEATSLRLVSFSGQLGELRKFRDRKYPGPLRTVCVQGLWEGLP